MATLTNPVFYWGGSTEAADFHSVGFFDNHNCVLRYDLNKERGESASRISILFDESGNGAIAYGGGQLEKVNKEMTFYFAISTDPAAFADAGYADISRATGKAELTLYRGSVANYDAYYRVLCEADVQLYPDTQYYLWVFPGFSSETGGNATWGWINWVEPLTITVDLIGNAGIAWVKTSAGIKQTVPYVRIAGEWKTAIPHVRKGNSWNACT